MTTRHSTESFASPPPPTSRASFARLRPRKGEGEEDAPRTQNFALVSGGGVCRRHESERCVSAPRPFAGSEASEARSRGRGWGATGTESEIEASDQTSTRKYGATRRGGIPSGSLEVLGGRRWSVEHRSKRGQRRIRCYRYGRDVFPGDVANCFMCFVASENGCHAARLSTPAPLSSSASCLRA
jgi:hypothetical protein